MAELGPKIARELETIQVMLRLYCRLRHGAPADCPVCSELLDYCEQRLARCPFGDEKSTCVRCTVHCYKAERREQVREVMRFSGPRMLLRHPLLALRHKLDSLRDPPLLEGRKGKDRQSAGTRPAE